MKVRCIAQPDKSLGICGVTTVFRGVEIGSCPQDHDRLSRTAGERVMRRQLQRLQQVIGDKARRERI